MSTDRQLGALPIARKETLLPALSGMDTWELTRCTSFAYSDDGDEGTHVAMKLASESGHWVRLALRNITSIEMSPLEPHFWLTQLEIRYVKDRGWEGVSFLLETDEEHAPVFRVYCGGLEVVECGPR